MSGQSVARGVGAFVLFLVLYTIIGAVIGAVALYFLDNPIIQRLIDYFSGNKNIYDSLLDLVAAAFAGFFGVPLAIAAQTAIMKKRPTRGVGVAFILWLAANYALHFIQFPELTDWTVYHGLVQSAVATVVAWVEFRLPPLMPRHNQTDGSHPLKAASSSENGADAMSDSQIINDGFKLAEAIRPLLVGHQTEVIDCALAQLLASLLATHHPDQRERMLARHVLLTGQMVPTMDQAIFSRRQRPHDWPPAKTLGPKQSDYNSRP